MSADTAALLACPFCGSTDAVRLDDGDSWDFLPDGEPLTWAVVCDYNRGGCGGSGGFRDSQKDAIAAWNQAADRLAALEAELASAREAERVQRERAERERDRAYLYRNAVPESADYVDALDHIMRTARRSRTQSRRLRWIEARARCALEGGEDWKELDLPRFSESNQRYLQARIAELEEALAAGGDR